ncbi:MAG: hypothetical protein ACR2H3_00640 [Acidimicrobiales bacterium]
MSDEHDDELGAALRDLNVPEHRPGFWERLERRLEADEVVDGSSDGASSKRVPVLSALARYLPLVIAALVILLIIILVVF